jgi:hypothetical protein
VEGGNLIEANFCKCVSYQPEYYKVYLSDGRSIGYTMMTEWILNYGKIKDAEYRWEFLIKDLEGRGVRLEYYKNDLMIVKWKEK